jgi:hypothetical protein
LFVYFKEPQTEPSDLLDKVKCLESLAALRHAKWFQVCFNLYLFTLMSLFKQKTKKKERKFKFF